MLLKSALAIVSLASLLPLALANPTGLQPREEAPPQWCCTCESCGNCDASCPDPGCGLFECCCAESHRIVARDGTARIFSEMGTEMNFVSRNEKNVLGSGA